MVTRMHDYSVVALCRVGYFLDLAEHSAFFFLELVKSAETHYALFPTGVEKEKRVRSAERVGSHINYEISPTDRLHFNRLIFRKYL